MCNLWETSPFVITRPVTQSTKSQSFFTTHHPSMVEMYEGGMPWPSVPTPSWRRLTLEKQRTKKNTRTNDPKKRRVPRHKEKPQCHGRKGPSDASWGSTCSSSGSPTCNCAKTTNLSCSHSLTAQSVCTKEVMKDPPPTVRIKMRLKAESCHSPPPNNVVRTGLGGGSLWCQSGPLCSKRHQNETQQQTRRSTTKFGNMCQLSPSTESQKPCGTHRASCYSCRTPHHIQDSSITQKNSTGKSVTRPENVHAQHCATRQIFQTLPGPRQEWHPSKKR